MRAELIFEEAKVLENWDLELLLLEKINGLFQD